MKRPHLAEGIIVALIISLAVTVVFSVMSAFFPTRFLLQILLASGSFIYILYLLLRSNEKTGRLTVLASVIVLIFFTWIFSPSMLISLFVHIGMIWLVRSLYYYTSLIISLFDLGLTLFAMAASIWTLMYTDSLFLALWCFFALQSLFAFLPTGLVRQRSGILVATPKRDNNDDHFERAWQSAQQALKQALVQH